ncbi:MAG: DNA polymerase III subunit gamma/tau [Alistipes sp.]|nr:DNA polymerase III subunit gamma/tau [Alistipes sp.]
MEKFIVSARKYRPATFASVVGQKHITSTLKNAIERNQLAHAYLFCGPRGVGKTTCARIFAKAINCLNPTGAEACNECESCRSFNDGRSLNIHELDAASNNSVDDIRTLIEQVRIIPQSGRYSVFIIDEVHMLSAAAFNAFLKTLEEPPAHAIFILATTEKHKIIPTILSRCQIYDFNRIRVEDSVEYLKYIAAQEGITSDDESLNLIAQKADGGMRDALSMFDKAVSFCGQTLDYREVAKTLNVLDYDTYFRITDLLLGGDYRSALLEFDSVLGRGFSAQTFVTGFNKHLRDLLVAKDRATLHLMEMTGTLLERYCSQGGRCEADFIFGGMSLLTETDGKLRMSSNQRLLVELTLMKIAGMGQKKNSGPDLPLADFTAEQPRRQTQSESPQAQEAAHVKAQEAPVAETAALKAQAVPAEAPVAEQAAAKPAETAATTAVAAPAAQVQAATQSAETASATALQADIKAEESRQQSTAARAARRPSVSGTSISSLLNMAPADSDNGSDSEPKEAATVALTVDPQAGQKLAAARNTIYEEIRRKRPRFTAAFENMAFDGSVIKLRVPSQALCDEILRTKMELLTRIAEMAKVSGSLEMEVTVDESIKASKPIKLEDRLKYITEKNPLVADLRKALDLDME